MGIVKSVAEGVAREIGSKSREFYEFVLPPVDMYMDGSGLTVLIDMPGFKKEEIKLSVSEDILSINAERDAGPKEGAICCQRPAVIDKKIRLPVTPKEDGEVTSATYSDGVLSLSFPAGRGRDIPIQ